MHVVTTTKALVMGPSLGELPAGRWLCSDANAFELAMIAERGTVKVEPWINYTPWHFIIPGAQGKVDVNSVGSILLIRSGAIGDLLFLTPCIAPLQARYPNATVTICCFKKHHAILANIHKTTVCDYPILEVHAKRYDLILGLENVIELAGSKHATEAFAEALGVTVTDYTPLYVVTSEEKNWAASSVPKGDKPRVALQLRASVKNRDYPMAQWNEVISGLVARGWEVLLYGSKGQVPTLPKNTPPEVIDCSSMTFREAAAVLATCDAFCGVDSAFVNLCPALGVPAIGLYGPFPWESRTSHSPKTRALSGVGDCAGCSWSPQAGRHFPPNKECSKTQVCSVLASIEPKRALAKIDQLKPATLQAI